MFTVTAIIRADSGVLKQAHAPGCLRHRSLEKQEHVPNRSAEIPVRMYNKGVRATHN